MKFVAKLFITVTILSSSCAQLHCIWPFTSNKEKLQEYLDIYYYFLYNATHPVVTFTEFVCEYENFAKSTNSEGQKYIRAKELLQKLQDTLDKYFFPSFVAHYPAETAEQIKKLFYKNCAKNDRRLCHKFLDDTFLSSENPNSLYAQQNQALEKLKYLELEINNLEKSLEINLLKKLPAHEQTEDIKNRIKEYAEERTATTIQLLNLLPKDKFIDEELWAKVLLSHKENTMEAEKILADGYQKDLHILVTGIDELSRQVQEYENKHSSKQTKI